MIFLIVYIIISILFLAFLIHFYQKIKKLESTIRHLFIKRSSLIPALFETTSGHLLRHKQVFQESLSLKKIELANHRNYTMNHFLDLESKIHHEMSFIFKITDKVPLLEKNGNFLLIREDVLSISETITKYLTIYNKISEQYEKIRKFKNLTLIGIFFNGEISH